jgi:ferrous iron transport protein B
VLIDLPGAYSLAAQSPDEMVAIDVLMGDQDDLEPPDAVLIVVDAANLRRNLFLVSQILELGKPVVIALNMADLADRKGIRIDCEELAMLLDSAVVPFVATVGRGIDELKQALADALEQGPANRPLVMPKVRQAARTIARGLPNAGRTELEYQAERAIIDDGGEAEKRMASLGGHEVATKILEIRASIGGGESLAALEAKRRYIGIDYIIKRVETRGKPVQSIFNRADRITNHPLIGAILFVLVMGTVFQAVFSWATPIMDLIDAGTAWIGGSLLALLPPGALASLLVDGVIAGVGSVIVFLPQILILFAFIIFLEDSGYMARAAFLMDRLMRQCGLSGQSFIPMLSSFACAVPGIMATRVIPNRRDRIATILAAPFMTCSARLPVYALLIGAFIPQQHFFFGIINLQGLVLFGLYMLGIFGGIFTALVLKRSALKGPTPTFLIELPPYRLPNIKSMLIRLLDRGKIFLVRAGTIIFTVAVVVWALAYFPRTEVIADQFDAERTAAAAILNEDALTARLTEINGAEAGAYLEQSYLGRMGKTVQPVFAPLGWDWKVSAAVIASFPAREVVVAVLGTIYAVGSDVDETDARLTNRLRSATWPNGQSVFTLGMAVGLLIFYAFCLQCVATIAMMRRETNGWTWPAFAWVYMTTLGYLGALLANQLGS